MKKKNKKGAIVVGTVLAVGLALAMFVGITSGLLGSLFRAGKTTGGILDILSAIPPVAWVIIGVFFLMLLMRRRRR